MKKITKVKTVTIMVDNNKFECDAFPLYLNSESQLETGTLRDLPVSKSNFKKQLTVLGALIRGGDDMTFSGLRFLVDLPDGRAISVRVKNLGAKGVFALASTGIDVPETTFNGKLTKDYRVMYDNQVFLTNLMERLEGVAALVANRRITVTLSKDMLISKTKWTVPRGQYPAIPFSKG